MYPIMFRQLFEQVGFGWAVRISGFISLAACCVAVLTTTSLHHPQPPAPQKSKSLDFAILRDAPFLLLIGGGILICFGSYS